MKFLIWIYSICRGLYWRSLDLKSISTGSIGSVAKIFFFFFFKPPPAFGRSGAYSVSP